MSTKFLYESGEPGTDTYKLAAFDIESNSKKSVEDFVAHEKDLGFSDEELIEIYGLIGKEAQNVPEIKKTFGVVSTTGQIIDQSQVEATQPELPVSSTLPAGIPVTDEDGTKLDDQVSSILIQKP